MLSHDAVIAIVFPLDFQEFLDAFLYLDVYLTLAIEIFHEVHERFEGSTVFKIGIKVKELVDDLCEDAHDIGESSDIS